MRTLSRPLHGNLPQTRSVCSDFSPDRRRLGILKAQATAAAPCDCFLPVCSVCEECIKDLAGDNNGRAGGIGGPNEAWL